MASIYILPIKAFSHCFWAAETVARVGLNPHKHLDLGVGWGASAGRQKAEKRGNGDGTRHRDCFLLSSPHIQSWGQGWLSTKIERKLDWKSLRRRGARVHFGPTMALPVVLRACVMFSLPPTLTGPLLEPAWVPWGNTDSDKPFGLSASLVAAWP